MTAFAWIPQTVEKTVTPRVRSARFGEGYEQRVGDGINTMPGQWSLSFSREASIIDAIEGYLVAAGGINAFDWTPPGESTAVRVVCREWSRTPHTGLRSGALMATFEQVFGS